VEIESGEFEGTCEDCKKPVPNLSAVYIGDKESWLCFTCLILLRDLAHEATCEKDVTGKCECWEGER
jgi:hypothetical protein